MEAIKQTSKRLARRFKESVFPFKRLGMPFKGLGISSSFFVLLMAALLLIAAVTTPHVANASWESADASRLIANIAKVCEIEVSGTYRLSKSEVKKALVFPSCEWVWKIAPWKLQQRLEANPWVRSARVSWSIYPLKLYVDVEEREPWLVYEDKKTSWLVGRNGEFIQPLSKVTNADVVMEVVDLPRFMESADEVDPRSYLASKSARISRAFTLIRFTEMAPNSPLSGNSPLSDNSSSAQFAKSESEAFKPSRYRLISDGSLEIEAEDFSKMPRILFNAEDLADANRSLMRLAMVLRDLRNRGESAKTVDLRFKNQVIVE